MRKKLVVKKYDTRVANGIMHRAYGVKLWHGAKHRNGYYQWRLEVWFGTRYYLIWMDK